MAIPINPWRARWETFRNHRKVIQSSPVLTGLDCSIYVDELTFFRNLMEPGRHFLIIRAIIL